MKEKVKKRVQELCDVLEYIVGGFVLIALVIAIITLIPAIQVFWTTRTGGYAFIIFLEKAFSVVIGIEFLQMLFRPNSENVMEILIFLVARHMVIGTTTPYQDFVSVISVGILCMLRRYLHDTKDRNVWAKLSWNKNPQGPTVADDYSVNEKADDKYAVGENDNTGHTKI